MNISQPLYRGKLIRRYKRFLADVELMSGEVVTAHSANTGSMRGCSTPGSVVLLSKSDNPKRKLKYSWELVEVNQRWICINTALPNRLVEEAIEKNHIPLLQGYSQIRREVRYAENSRIDLLLERPGQHCYVEVKNVTLMENETALFPDAVTTRGQKHLRDLMQMIDEGHRSIIFFVVNRSDCNSFSPANDVDPVYGKLLREAIGHGVEALAYQTRITPPEIILSEKLPVLL